jgi:hypothetical protein
MPEVTVILVNYNDKAHLGDCLLSLKEKAVGIDFEAIVVDNASSDGSLEFIADRFPWVKAIRNSENCGFGRANNQALKESWSDFVLFLNTDTVIYPEALQTLLQEMKNETAIGVIAPALLTSENTCQVSFGTSVTFLAELLKKSFWNFFLKSKLRIWQKRKAVSWVGGACLLARRKALDEVGGFDENFFLYFEDIDLCFRIKRCGWKIIFLPQIRIFHQGGASAAAQKPWNRLEYRKSQVYFYRKHNSWLSLFLLRRYLRLNFWLLSARGTFKGAENAILRSGYLELLKTRK